MYQLLGLNMVRVIHTPTGITVYRDSEHGAHQSKHKLLRCALREMRARVYSARRGLNSQPASLVREYDFIHKRIMDIRTGNTCVCTESTFITDTVRMLLDNER